MLKSLDERSREAWINGNIELSTALARIVELEATIEVLDGNIEDARADSLNAWEKKNGPANEYKEFFEECFQRLGKTYPCPSVTSDYDKSIIFDILMAD